MNCGSFGLFSPRTYQFSQKVRPNILPSVCAVLRLPGVVSNSSCPCSVELKVSGFMPARTRGIEYWTSTFIESASIVFATSFADGWSKVLAWQSKQSYIGFHPITLYHLPWSDDLLTGMIGLGGSGASSGPSPPGVISAILMHSASSIVHDSTLSRSGLPKRAKQPTVH